MPVVKGTARFLAINIGLQQAHAVRTIHSCGGYHHLQLWRPTLLPWVAGKSAAAFAPRLSRGTLACLHRSVLPLCSKEQLFRLEKQWEMFQQCADACAAAPSHIIWRQSSWWLSTTVCAGVCWAERYARPYQFGQEHPENYRCHEARGCC